jgi:hypothetical protein
LDRERRAALAAVATGSDDVIVAVPPPPQRQTAAVVGGGGDKVGAEGILGRGKQDGFVRIGQLTLLRRPADGVGAAARHTAHLKQLKTINPPRKNLFAFHL